MTVRQIPVWFIPLLGAWLLSPWRAGHQPRREDAPLEGFVLDREGKAAAGIEVVLTWRLTTGFETQLLGKVTTDSNGHFSFPKRPITRTYEESRLIAFGPHGEQVEMDVRGAAGAFQLRLPPTSKCLVHVFDPQGKPAAGQRLELYPFGACPPELRSRHEFTADGSGNIALTYNAHEQLFVRCPDEAVDTYASPTVNFSGEGVTRDWPIHLKPACGLVGRLVSQPGGLPEPNVKVRASLLAMGAPQWRDAITDAEGHFGFKKLWPGSYTLEAPNCVVLDQEPRDPFRGEQVLEGATLDVGVLKIEKPAHLRCTVRDMRTHKPVSRALINATWPGTEGKSWPQTWEASDAGVADVVVRTGEIKLSVSGIEARRTVRADQPCYVLIEIDANLPGVYGEHSNEELPSTIVTVVDAAGSPVPFANIEEVHGFGRYLSDAHGQFDLDGFNPDSEIWVRKGGLATRNSAYTGSDTSVRSTTFRLGAGVLGGARGRIRDVGGRDLAGAVVDITDDDPQWVYGVYATFMTAPDGSFKVEGLCPGAEFRIVYRGAASAWFSVRAGELKELGDVQLTESPKYD